MAGNECAEWETKPAGEEGWGWPGKQLGGEQQSPIHLTSHPAAAHQSPVNPIERGTALVADIYRQSRWIYSEMDYLRHKICSFEPEEPTIIPQLPSNIWIGLTWDISPHFRNLSGIFFGYLGPSIWNCGRPLSLSQFIKAELRVDGLGWCIANWWSELITPSVSRFPTTHHLAPHAYLRQLKDWENHFIVQSWQRKGL